MVERSSLRVVEISSFFGGQLGSGRVLRSFSIRIMQSSGRIRERKREYEGEFLGRVMVGRGSHGEFG